MSMDKFLKKLPLLAFVLAAFAAFAFSPADNQSSEYGFDGQNWINVTGLVPGPETYQCDEDPQVCTRRAPNSSAQPVKTGLFINNMN